MVWEAPPTELQNGVIRHYQVTTFEVDTGMTVTHRATASTAFTVGELHPYYTYRISVAAVTVAAGPSSLPVSVLTLQDGELTKRNNQAVCHVVYTVLLCRLIIPGSQLKESCVWSLITDITAFEIQCVLAYAIEFIVRSELIVQAMHMGEQILPYLGNDSEDQNTTKFNKEPKLFHSACTYEKFCVRVPLCEIWTMEDSSLIYPWSRTFFFPT